MKKHAASHLPKPKWLVLRGESEILGKAETLRALLRDTTIPAGDFDRIRIVAPSGMKMPLTMFTESKHNHLVRTLV